MIKNKLIYVLLVVILLLSTTVTKAAIKPQPKIELDQYEMEVSSVNNIYIEGSVSLARGQWITLHTSTDNLPINYIITQDSNRAEDFKIKVPSSYLNEGINTFHITSKSLKNRVSASNFKTITIKVKTSSTTAKKSQTITASNKTMTVGQTLNLNAKASSGLKLTYSTNNQNATVDSTGKVIARKTGITKVIIDQTGNSKYKSATKTITITIKQKIVAKKNQTITASNKIINVGKTASLNAKTNSKLKLIYKSSSPKIVSVTSKGVVKGLKSGKSTIIITQTGNTKFKAATKKIVVTVNKNTQKIIASNKTVDAGKSVLLKAKASSGLKLTYKSSNSKIASVNAKGVVTGKKAGKTVIIIKQAGNFKFKPVTKKATITVKKVNKKTNKKKTNKKKSSKKDNTSKNNNKNSKCSHDWGYNGETKGNCVTPFYMLKKCKKCGATKSIKGKVVPDVHKSKKTRTDSATCTEDGRKTTVCTSCNTIISSHTLDALGHNWKYKSGKVWRYKKCKRCGKTVALYKLPKNNSRGKHR